MDLEVQLPGPLVGKIKEMEPEIYELYKPVRNHLQTLYIPNALYVIWAYINFMQFGVRFPNDIEVPPDFIEAENRIARGLFEWEIALLAREVLVNGQEAPFFASKSLQRWSYFANAINKIKGFENNMWPVIGNASNLHKEMLRIARRQFPWQIPPHSALFLRYFKIYSNSRIASIIENRIGISLQKWYIVGTAILGATLSNPKLNIDPEIEIKNVTIKDFNTLLSYISTDLSSMREIIKKEIKYDDRFVYSFNPLEYYPLIKIDQYYFCPINTLLAWRITSGIYFEMVDDKNFGGQFGFAFQEYLLEVANKIACKDKVKVMVEEKYRDGKSERDTVDIILADNNSAFFVEAKTKRPTARSKSEFSSDEGINRDIAILAEAVVQIYSTIRDYEKNLYPQLPFNHVRNIYPLVVTIEDWFIFGSDAENLLTQVKDLMNKKDLSLVYLEKMPYAVCSSFDYESLVQILNYHSIKEVMDIWFVPEKLNHNFGQHIVTHYKSELKHVDDYFPGDFEEIFPKFSPATG